MPEHYKILLPSKPRIISEKGFSGVYEIDGLYPGYGHTLGNSLRRIILSSIPGVSITTIKVDGVDHEFSTIKGIKEDVINIILNLKNVRFKVVNDEEQTVHLKVKGIKDVTAKIISSSKNKLNIARAAMLALSVFDKKRHIAVSTEAKVEVKSEVKK